MMRQMRENTKWIMLVTALAFVALMVFEWGMDMTGRSGSAVAGEMGRVNGESVSYEEWLAVYRNVYQQQQSAIDGPITSAMTRQIEDAAWDQIVTQRLLQQGPVGALVLHDDEADADDDQRQAGDAARDEVRELGLDAVDAGRAVPAQEHQQDAGAAQARAELAAQLAPELLHGGGLLRFPGRSRAGSRTGSRRPRPRRRSSPAP